MRASALVGLWAIWSLDVAASSTPTCHADQPLPADNVDKVEIANSVRDGIGSFCNFPSWKHVIQNNHTSHFVSRASVNLEINRPTGNFQPTQAHCIEAFLIVLEQCIVGKGAFGEYASSDGLSYQISHDGVVPPGKRGLDARARNKKPKPVKTTKKAPAAEKTTTSAKPAPTPKLTAAKKPTPTPKPTPAKKPTPSKSKATPKATPTPKGKRTRLCKDIARKAAAANKPGKPITKKPGKPTTSKPGKNVAKPPTKGDRPLLRRSLSPKKAVGANRPCGADWFWSNEYRDYQDHLSHHPNTRAFGFAKLMDCSSYDWVARAGTPQFAQSQASSSYATEHLLEWQNIASFFNYLADEVFNTQQYVHPDPSKNEMCDFKTYFQQHWAWGRDPAQKFTLPGGGPAATPFRHIANAYPSDANRADELVLLQAEMNGIKGRIFGAKQAYDKIETESWVQGDPHPALWRVRQALGLQRYLQETRNIFAAQVTRIRDVLDTLDNTLPAHPRRITGSNPRVLRPWVPVGLRAHFEKYMDNIWYEAQQELATFISNIHDKIRPHCGVAKKRQYEKDQNQDMIDLCNNWEAARRMRATYGEVQKPW